MVKHNFSKRWRLKYGTTSPAQAPRSTFRKSWTHFVLRTTPEFVVWIHSPVEYTQTCVRVLISFRGLSKSYERALEIVRAITHLSEHLFDPHHVDDAAAPNPTPRHVSATYPQPSVCPVVSSPPMNPYVFFAPVEKCRPYFTLT